ncbi:unnamed protein product, partial [Timema podura]|nr:unnamed protein product [Timema podura]
TREKLLNFYDRFQFQFDSQVKTVSSEVVGLTTNNLEVSYFTWKQWWSVIFLFGGARSKLWVHLDWPILYVQLEMNGRAGVIDLETFHTERGFSERACHSWNTLEKYWLCLAPVAPKNRMGRPCLEVMLSLRTATNSPQCPTTEPGSRNVAKLSKAVCLCPSGSADTCAPFRVKTRVFSTHTHTHAVVFEKRPDLSPEMERFTWWLLLPSVLATFLGR